MTKVELGGGEERRMEKMRVGSVSYEMSSRLDSFLRRRLKGVKSLQLVVQDVEERYNMPRGSCRLFSVDQAGEEVTIGSTSWDELDLDEDVRARFDSWPVAYHRSSPSTARFFDFDR